MTYKKLFASVLIASVAILLHTGHASAATINVAGSCDLNAAIVAMNTQTDGSCTKTGSYGSADTLTLPAGTITLAADPTSVLVDLTVTGAGKNSTFIDGASAYRPFKILTDNGATNFSISDLTINHASNSVSSSKGAAIYSQVPTFNMNSVSIHDSVATNEGGGGIYIEYGVTVSITNSDIYNNSANYGGGAFIVAESGTVTLVNTTVHDNNASGGIGGLMIGAQDLNLSNLAIFNNAGGSMIGGAQLGASRNFAMKNSTVYNNTAASGAVGGIAVIGITTLSNAKMQNVSIIGNNGSSSDNTAAGLFIANFDNATDPVIQLENVLLSNNKDNGNPSNCGLSGSLPNPYWPHSLGHNLSDDATCAIAFNQTGDLNSTSAGLDSWAQDGDTWVYSLLANSPAIDSGATVGGLTDDQRGTARPQGAAYDIGAYEAVLGANTGDNSGGSGDSSGGAGGSSNSQGSNSDDSAGKTVAAPHTGLASASPMVAGILVGSGLVTYIGYSVLKRRRLI